MNTSSSPEIKGGKRIPNTVIEIPSHVRQIQEVLERHGKTCFMVGGCVRDAIRGIPPEETDDIDLATDALPEEVMSYFPKTVPTGIKYGTVLVILDGVPYEVTTLRGDGAYTDGRRPESVQFATDIHEDLSRRDFTMNALALDCRTNEIIDDFGGMEDIDSKTLRAVGVPEERFREDGLRIMRAFRFMRYGTPDEALEHAIRSCRDMLSRISQERITTELLKIFESPESSHILTRMMDSGIFGIIAPEVDALQSVDDPVHGKSVWDHSIETIDRIERNTEQATTGVPMGTLKLAALLHDVGKPLVERIDVTNMTDPSMDTFPGHELRGAAAAGLLLERMKCSNMMIESVRFLIRSHMDPVRLRGAPVEELRLFRHSSGEYLDALLCLSKANHGGLSGGRKAECSFHHAVMSASIAPAVEPLLNGMDIMTTLDIPQGRRIGEIKNELFDIQIRNDVRNKDEMLNVMLDLFKT